MPRIHILSQHTANQIAAGEVVERPVSIVKELVENALDAGATHVHIEIEGGGIERILVSDDGYGIPDEDTETAFLRHATSKLNSADDLAHIETLGFRGEALASIAAVSSTRLLTCEAAEELGSELLVRGGELQMHKRIGHRTGTAVEVTELFYNAPARLKFLKSPRAESGAIGEYAAKLIMSRPAAAVHYVNNGHTIYQSFGDGKLMSAILCVYGMECAKQLYEIAFDDGYLKISGFVGSPAISRLNRSAQTICINHRIIRSASISNALSRAYSTRLPNGRFPFAALSLQMASAEVDVNVHPAKLEARFRDEPRVIRSVYVACSEAITRSFVPSATDAADPSYKYESPAVRDTGGQHRFSPYETRSWPGSKLRHTLREDSFEDSAYLRTPPFAESSVYHASRSEDILISPFDAPYEIIGCAFQTYWFVQQENVLYCIDQHAAHERLLYDALMARRVRVDSQLLLLPEAVKLTPDELETLHTFQGELEEFGFSFEESDALAVRLLAVPQINGKTLNAAFLHDMLARFVTDGGDLLQTQDTLRHSIVQSACKHAVKAGDPLVKEQIKALLDALSAGDALLTCPHGRPVIVRLSKTDLEKWFGRIP